MRLSKNIFASWTGDAEDAHLQSSFGLTFALGWMGGGRAHPAGVRAENAA
jgi:hypothetical protein